MRDDIFVEGRRNWIAIQYQTPLQAEKAKGQTNSSLPVSGGTSITIGVCSFREDDHDFYFLTTGGSSTKHLPPYDAAAGTSSSTTTMTLFHQDDETSTTAASNKALSTTDRIRTDGGLKESDILLSDPTMSSSSDVRGDKKRSCFESFMRYLLSLND
jgi:hypothetical protein